MKKPTIADFAETLFKPTFFTLSNERIQLRLPFEEKQLVFIASRGMGKSMLIAAKMWTLCVARPGTRCIYAAPDDRQVKQFVYQSLDPLMHHSTIIPTLFANKQLSQGVSTKRMINGSAIFNKFVGHGEEAMAKDSARGTHGDVLFMDEVQDWAKSAHDVMISTVDQSPLAWLNYSGTFKSEHHFSYWIWKKSSQNEWVVKCEHCNRYNGDPDHLFHIVNIGKDGPICWHCGKLLNIKKGFWLRTNPSAQFEGYRFHHLMAFWLRWPIILRNLELQSESTFINETLGLPVADVDQYISEHEIRSVCREDIKKGDHDKTAVHVIGIDWQGDKTKTVVTVIKILPNKWIVVDMKRFEGAEAQELNLIGSVRTYCNRWKPRLIVADYGFGTQRNAELQEFFGNACYNIAEFVWTQKVPIRWNKMARRWIVEKFQVMEWALNLIKARQVEFFRYSEFEPFAKEFYSLFKDYTRTGHPQFNHDADVLDDCVASYTFACVAARLLVGADPKKSHKLLLASYNTAGPLSITSEMIDRVKTDKSQ